MQTASRKPEAAILVIGTGSWGLAVGALLAARTQNRVMVLGRDPARCAELAAARVHPETGTAFPPNLIITADAADPAVAAAGLVFWAVPTQFTAAEAARLAPALPAAPVVSLSKGLEQTTERRVSEILAATLPGRGIACLSGPALAAEAVRGLPLALVAAGADDAVRATVAALHGGAVRIYTSSDLIGVELAGALKNVIAIAAGCAEGLGFGDNARAALITRGLAELRRLGRRLGASDATAAGLAGMGDLVASCVSPLGRNRALGLALGRGEPAASLLARSRGVAEGAWTARAAVALGERHAVELPIASQVASVIWLGKPVAHALRELLARTPKDEDA
jgi:glycerol-3-phosphate dehydrogenase (NAD(P)+)